MSKLYSRAFLTVFANDNDSLTPELWANEGLMILEAQMVAGKRVHRDFSATIQRFGDVVNTRKPSSFTAKRKVDSENVTIQDAISTNIPVKLNQWIHTSFLIGDGEETKAFKDLVVEYLKPVLSSIANKIDESICGLAYNFIGKPSAGRLGTAIDADAVIELREALNASKAPMEGRTLLLGHAMESDLLKDDIFVSAEKVGDNGTALRTASLGTKFGFDIFMDQNMPAIAAGQTTVAGAVNFAAGYPAGTTTMTVDGLTAAVTDGCWFTVAGDDTPQRLISSVGGATPTSLTFWPGLTKAVVDNAVITIVTPTTVSATYDANYHLPLTVASSTIKVGQLLSFGTSTNTQIYSATSGSTNTSVILNRVLDTGVTASDVMGKGPSGSYGLGFTKNAIGLINRPLAAPKQGTGAASAVASYNDFSIRITIAYDANKQGHLVTVDTLFGIKVLDDNLGAVIYG